MGMQPILPVTVAVIKIKGAAHQSYGDGMGVARCEQTFKDPQRFVIALKPLFSLIFANFSHNARKIAR